ncbi:MAG TPA: MBL fold metallo-hydrolase [Kiritimatiellia bacterium]|nr:MBL fold metallo-hydrolase [Kiritimatiellia bacterium]HRZ10964.1 MBL fold metallo-hydrolase [Kiritimatiellia bacterium]HSA18537.1 MBL fold metallo-hydrolase [Kiritimatiellia bacterium]
MNIECIVVGPFEVNSYIAHRGAGGEALVIDPGADADLLRDALRRLRLRPAAYLLTHGHVDHVSALAALHREWPAPVILHELDAPWAFTPVNELPPYYAAPAAPAGAPCLVKDGEARTDGPFRYRVIATPGHTPGGVAFHLPDERVLFAGDTLFQGTVGRTDLPGGDARALARSVLQLGELPDDTRVFPGHGPATTIGEEKRSNFFMHRAAS